jgi:hypothetical protein
MLRGGVSAWRWKISGSGGFLEVRGVTRALDPYERAKRSVVAFSPAEQCSMLNAQSRVFVSKDLWLPISINALSDPHCMARDIAGMVKRQKVTQPAAR